MKKNNRPFAKCPKCGELERTRLASLVLESIYSDQKASKTDVLHISPENSLRKKFQKNYKSYISADLHRKDVDRQFDVQNIPFSDESFDLVFASHVLEYPEDDRKAMSEIRRILRKDGIAILPVPLIHKKTKDNIERNPINRMMHEPGLDFFDRYKDFFSSVKIYDPESFDHKFNLHEHETLNLLPVCKV
jgi:SAM-dependent methyltransferase